MNDEMVEQIRYRLGWRVTQQALAERDAFDELLAERDELRAKLAEAEKDAARYRYIEKNARMGDEYDIHKPPSCHWGFGIHSSDKRKGFAGAIDAAMEQKS